METRKLKRVVIKEELFALTGDTIETIILSQFLYWMDRVKDFDKFIKEEKQRSLDDGQNLNIELQNGWVYKKASELIDECMLNVSEVTVRRYIQNLCKKGYLDSRKNPAHKWDKTLQYRVNLKFIISELKKLKYDGLSDYVVLEQQNEETELQNEGMKFQNEAAITEITTETTNKETYTKVYEKKDETSSCQSEYERFDNWVKNNAPYCYKNMKAITEAEYNKMNKTYKPKQICFIIEQIENRKDLRKRYTNLYRTVLNWAKKEYGDKGTTKA